MSKIGILICGHGTRKERGAEAFRNFARRFADANTEFVVEYGFLELSEPDFEQGVKRLVDQSVSEIIAIPVFLFTGVHIQKDIPFQLHGLQEKYQVKIRLANYIGACAEMLDYAAGLIDTKLQNVNWNPDETALLGLGIGASKAEANGDLAKLTRLIQEKQNFAFALNAFTSSMTYPALPEVLKWLELLPFKNIVMLPFVFFPGVYMDRALESMKVFAEQNPNINILITDLLGDSDGLFELLKIRLQEVLDGKVDLIASTDLSDVDLHHHHHHDHGHSHHH